MRTGAAVTAVLRTPQAHGRNVQRLLAADHDVVIYFGGQLAPTGLANLRLQFNNLIGSVHHLQRIARMAGLPTLFMLLARKSRLLPVAL